MSTERMEDPMDMKKCKVIKTIAETGNLSKAAELLGYTQPGISNILKSIEQETGFPMFTRVHEGMLITKEAQSLLPTIYNILAECDNLSQQIDAINGITSGSIAIGSYSSVSKMWLAAIINQFLSKYPDIKITIKEGGINEIEQGLDNFTLDMAFISRQDYHNYKWKDLYADPLMLVTPADYPYETEPFPVKMLHNQPFIVHEECTDPDTEHLIESLKKKGILPDIKYTSTYDLTIISMVEQNLCLGIVSDLILKFHPGKVKQFRLDPPAYRYLGIATRADTELSPAAARFYQFAIDYVALESER